MNQEDVGHTLSTQGLFHPIHILMHVKAQRKKKYDLKVSGTTLTEPNINTIYKKFQVG